MATALNDLVACIQATESSPTELKKLLSHLQAQEEVLIQHMPQLDDASQALTPHLHTLGLVYILNVKGSAVPLSNAAAVTMFIAQCRRLLLGCDPAQAQMVPAQFVAVCTKFSAACLAGGGSPLTAVRPLQAAALALQPTMTHFTPLHAECLRVCLLAKTYSAARPLLEQELLHVDREATLVTPRDLLLFHYYAGMVHTGQKQYKQAVNAFTLCVSAPTHVLNAIMLEAYKKALLCSLVECGEPPKLPKYVSPSIARPIKALAAYSEYAEAFASGEGAKLRECLVKHTAAFQADKNLGLAKQCLPALMRKSIRQLTETYLTLSLGQIAEIAGLEGADAAARQIRDMIAAGDIHASIDEPKGMVRFLETAERFDSHATVAQMEAALQGAIGLAGRLTELHASLATDQHYLARIASQERAPNWDDEALLSK